VKTGDFRSIRCKPTAARLAAGRLAIFGRVLVRITLDRLDIKAYTEFQELCLTIMAGQILPADKVITEARARIIMKFIRAGRMSLLVAAMAGVLAGCATASHDSYTALNDGSGLEQKQPSPTEDMTPVQTAGYYLGWFSLASLYAWAGGSAPILPP
jgi:hypothetical protein